MNDIISEIIKIEKEAALEAGKAEKKAKGLEVNAERELSAFEKELAEKARRAAAAEDRKCAEQIKKETEKIRKDTELKIKKMNEYYDQNKERILSELLEKALKA